MTFVHPWLLPVALLPLVWMVWVWRSEPSRLRLVLKAVSLTAVLIALAQPEWRVSESKVAVAVLADTSASIGAEDLARESQIASQIEGQRGRHWTKVIPFAADRRNPQKTEVDKGWRLQNTTGEPGRSTDLEGAVRDGMAALPSGLIPRLVLVSDGLENRGSITRAAWQARQLGVPIDTYALAGRPRPALRLESASVPTLAFTGERFPIDLLVSSPRAAEGTVEISAEGKSLGSSKVKINVGTTPLRVYASIATPGAIDIAGAVRGAGLGEVRFEEAVRLRRPRVLYFSQDPAGTEKNLVDTLQAAQFEIQPSQDLARQSLRDYQLVVFNNWDLESLPAAFKDQLETYVKEGGGLLVIGGERNVYTENKKTEDGLDRALPAKLAPPRSPEGTCVVLIIDKSSSMEGRKMDLARLAAIGVVDNLRPVDFVGVLIFDNSFQWAVPVRKAEDRTLIKRLIAGITPDGGTQIAPALSEAYRRILGVNATYKHVVLLTDGISEEGDSVSLSKEAAERKVTISTVGLGQDVNRAYLEKVAVLAKGKAYFLSEPSGLEQILIKDVKEHTGSTTVEKPITAQMVKQADILEGVGFDSAPPLKGYVRFIAKPTAETILKVDKDDPLLSRWQYGLGRAAVFTSDAKSRWAAQWIGWSGYDKFWANLLRDLLPHAQSSEAVAEFDNTSGSLVVTYRLGERASAPANVPDIFVLGPNNFKKAIPVRKVAADTYRGELKVGNREGLFRIRPVVDSSVFPEIGLYRQEEELQQYGNNEQLLRQVAAFTGGTFQPTPGDVFQARGRNIETVVECWPGLLALAVALSVAELFLRKWRGLQGSRLSAAAGA